VPIGLIDDCTSGTMAQAWTSKEALQAVPMLRHYVTEEDLATADYPAQLDAYHQAVTKFQSDLAAFNASADAAKAAGGPVPANPPKPPVPPVESARWPNGAAHEFNGMIAPIIPYAMRGVIWYQGESNAPQAYEYETLFPTLIADWRSRWQEGDFPFLYVQAAPYMNIRTNPMPNDAGGWQELREAQRHTLSVAPNTGMAVITDLGDSKTAHARRKEPVGERLALLAEALVYGKSVESSGPQFEYATPEGATMRVKFSHATGLKTIDVHDGSDAGPLIASEGTVTGFELAGPNGRYVMANAVIDGETVVVSSPKVTQPVGVRYGWANYPVVNLANSAGLPASPFKSDPWPLASQSKTVTTGP